MAKRTCKITECERRHSARGLCAMHWKREHGKRTKYPRVCETCTNEYMSNRATGRFCSDQCKGVAYHLERGFSRLPDDHPVSILISTARITKHELAAARARERRRVRQLSTFAWRTARECPGCACTFTPLYTCSRRCQRRVTRWRRAASERDAIGTFTWSQFMHIVQRFDYQCAYCGDRPQQLEPDHVVPLSRGGMNSTTNLLPACRQCNGDKRNLLLHEWALDRAARGKPRRVTSWPTDDARYWHLTQAMLSTTAA